MAKKSTPPKPTKAPIKLENAPSKKLGKASGLKRGNNPPLSR